MCYSKVLEREYKRLLISQKIKIFKILLKMKQKKYLLRMLKERLNQMPVKGEINKIKCLLNQPDLMNSKNQRCIERNIVSKWTTVDNGKETPTM